MRKVIVSNLMTLDGYIARPNGDLDWFVTNDEFFDDTPDQMDQADTLLYGRVTYEGMASYWPTEMAAQQNPAAIHDRMNAIAKVVFSKTLDHADWNNSRIVKGDLGEEVRRMKQQPGKDMIIFGSGQIVSALAELGLIDIYRIFLNPVALGVGKSMFAGLTHAVKLNLLKSRTLRNGVVVLEYEPQQA